MIRCVLAPFAALWLAACTPTLDPTGPAEKTNGAPRASLAPTSELPIRIDAIPTEPLALMSVVGNEFPTGVGLRAPLLKPDPCRDFSGGPSLGFGVIGCDTPCDREATERASRNRTGGSKPVCGRQPPPYTKGCGLTASEVRRTIRQQRAGLVACYEALLENRRAASGGVSVRWGIAANGKAHAARVVHDAIGARSFTDCLLRTVNGWQFEAPRDGKPMTATYPFHFRVVTEPCSGTEEFPSGPASP